MSIFDFFKSREQLEWGYGTDPANEVRGITSTEITTRQYVEDNSAILKRTYWAKKHNGIVLINFDTSLPRLSFVDNRELTTQFPDNVAHDILLFLNSNGSLSGYVDGLIVVGERGNGYSIQDFPLHGRDTGKSYLVN